MAQRNVSSSAAKQRVKQSAQRATSSPWFERLARFGYAAKGVVYLVVGALSARAAFGLGGATTDSRGALLTILSEPFGQIMLVLIGIGLIGYVLLRLVQAIMDPEHKGRDAKGIAVRIGYLISALVYSGLAWSALRLAIGVSGTSSNQGQGWIVHLFSLPLGRWLVGIAGLLVIVRCYRFYSAPLLTARGREAGRGARFLSLQNTTAHATGAAQWRNSSLQSEKICSNDKQRKAGRLRSGFAALFSVRHVCELYQP